MKYAAVAAAGLIVETIASTANEKFDKDLEASKTRPKRDLREKRHLREKRFVPLIPFILPELKYSAIAASALIVDAITEEIIEKIEEQDVNKKNKL